MQSDLGRLDRQMKLENRLYFFLTTSRRDSSTAPEFHQIGIFRKIKNLTSKLHPSDTGNIRNMKSKYRKRLTEKVVSLLHGKSTT